MLFHLLFSSTRSRIISSFFLSFCSVRGYFAFVSPFSVYFGPSHISPRLLIFTCHLSPPSLETLFRYPLISRRFSATAFLFRVPSHRAKEHGIVRSFLDFPSISSSFSPRPSTATFFPVSRRRKAKHTLYPFQVGHLKAPSFATRSNYQWSDAVERNIILLSRPGLLLVVRNKFYARKVSFL